MTFNVLLRYFRSVAPLLAAGLLGGVVAACSSLPQPVKPPQALKGWSSLPEVARGCGVTTAGWHVSAEGARLTSSRYNIRLFAESRRMEVNGTVVWLNAPLTAYPVKSTRFFLSPADAADIAALHAKQPARLPQNRGRRFFTVMLDPGHGGDDSGARSTISAQVEKDINLDIAQRVSTALARAPVQVIMVRRDDVTMPLELRPLMAANNSVDCFVSIHVNAAANNTANGFETYVLPAAGYPATNGGEVREPGIGNRHNAASITLAYAIQSRLNKLGLADRGVKRARFHVLQNAPCPAVLVETGFISHDKEARLLTTTAHRQKIAEAIAAAIRAYAE